MSADVVEALRLRAGDGPAITGIVAHAPVPRALLLALHGGGMHSGYFHGAAHPSLSLLRLGASLGFSVLALDRPGYEGSAADCPDGLPIDEQAAVLFDALEVFASAYPTGAGVVLVGHSAGAMVALAMAGRAEPPLPVLGVEFSGIGVDYWPSLHAGGSPVGAVADDPARRRSLNWAPAALFPPVTFEPGVRPGSGSPARDGEMAVSWSATMPRVAAGVRAPVRWTVAAHEGWWDVSDEGLARGRDMFAAAPIVELREQVAANHNISLGWAARAYHLSVLSFAEDCLLRVGGDLGDE